MDILITIVLLLVALLISNIISRYIPFIPTALTQIALGIIIALVFNVSLEIETEFFLLLFVAPLLYNEGRHFPREQLWKMRAPIFGNAIILVLLTTIGGGYFIHWMIPDIPIAAALALAAILSPTDPVAVNGIAKRIHIPEKVLNLVRGESLINDASGLVAFNYAVIAVVTGYFSIREATLDFAYMFVAGAMLGLILGLLIAWMRFTLRKKGIGDVTFHSLLQILTPFIIFIITEELLHASGVIAVVVAGVIHSLLRERTETIIAEEQVLTENIWSIVLYVLNGIVFLILGLVIPSSMAETVVSPNMGNWLIVGFVIVIGIVILGIRFVWSYFFSYGEYRFSRAKDKEKPTLRMTLIISLTGVRGAVTMAGVLSLPLVILSGAVFPERSLILFLAAGVILFTLIVATAFLPMLSKGELVEGDSSSEADLNTARKKLLAASIEKLKLEMNDDNRTVAYQLIAEYRMMYKKIQFEQKSSEQIEQYQQTMREIRLVGLRAERAYINDVMDDSEVDESVFVALERSFDYREEALTSGFKSRIIYLVGKIRRDWLHFRVHYHKGKDDHAARLSIGQDIQLRAFQAAIESLEKYAEVAERVDIVNTVIFDYKTLIERLSASTVAYYEKREEQKEELRLILMEIERAEIHRMYESGEIGREQAKVLRRFVNYIESVILHEHVE